MCGIFGTLAIEGISNKHREKFIRMSDLTQHRGPDSFGEFSNSQLIVGMRRLSIVGVTNGNQPIWNSERKVGIVANGEIYNHNAIRNQIAQLGYEFSTLSDVECILKLYEYYGLDFAHKLRGMFAFAIIDLTTNRLILGRDSIGEKPLYIHESDGVISFASELSVLVKSKVADLAINSDMLPEYFKYGFVPEPNSMIKGIRKLNPGSLEIFDFDGLNNFSIAFSSKLSNESASSYSGNGLQEALLTVGSEIFQSEVPIGIALSGGVDSALVCSLASKFGINAHALSVGYSKKHSTDESGQAAEISQQFGLQFSKILISPQDVAKSFSEMVKALDEPIADPSSFGYFSLGQHAKKLGIKVLLSGHGGDELFWGYSWIDQVIRKNIRRNKTLDFRTRIWEYLKIEMPPLRAGELLDWASAGLGLFENMIQLKEDLKSRNSGDRKLLMFESVPRARIKLKNARKLIGKNYIDRSSFEIPFGATAEKIGDDVRNALIETYLRVNGLAQIDRLWMWHSVEGRTLLVDSRIVQHALNSPLNKYGRLNSNKSYLKNSLEVFLPPEILKKPKRGFTPPVKLWLKAIHRELRLDKTQLRVVEMGLLTPYTYKFLKTPHTLLGRTKPLWLETIILELWLRMLEIDRQAS